MAEIASARAATHDLLLDVFVGPLNDALIADIKDGRLDALLVAHTEPGGERIRGGARLVASWFSSAANGSQAVPVKELLVDRTRLLRATGEKGFRPPYESLYVINPAGDGSLLQVINRFYRNAGLLLEDESCESPDFLFVELDFMKQLCLREVDESLSGASADATRATEREFLRRHLGSWAGAYCIEAEKHAQTDFYRGFLAVLDGFIATEMSYFERRLLPHRLLDRATSEPEVDESRKKTRNQ